jgi:hypothetical protein
MNVFDKFEEKQEASMRELLEKVDDVREAPGPSHSELCRSW